MCLRATMRRPLRSKRATISPVRPRAKASGFTRMRVRSMRPGRLAAGRRSADGGAPRRRRRHWRLAVRADAPARIERPAAALARVLELRHAVRADEERALDVAMAVRARRGVELRQARLRGRDLELTLADVLEILRRPHDHVD